MLFNSKKHREIEKARGLKKDSIKEAVQYLVKTKANVDEVVKCCKEWVEAHPHIKFEIAFNMYVSALKNPKLKNETNK